MVIEFNNKNNSVQIRKLIEVLSNDYATSRDANRRKGALIGLAATGLGLGKVSDKQKLVIKLRPSAVLESYHVLGEAFLMTSYSTVVRLC